MKKLDPKYLVCKSLNNFILSDFETKITVKIYAKKGVLYDKKTLVEHKDYTLEEFLNIVNEIRFLKKKNKCTIYTKQILS